jgi:hypothetical protein
METAYKLNLLNTEYIDKIVKPSKVKIRVKHEPATKTE